MTTPAARTARAEIEAAAVKRAFAEVAAVADQLSRRLEDEAPAAEAAGDTDGVDRVGEAWALYSAATGYAGLDESVFQLLLGQIRAGSKAAGTPIWPLAAAAVAGAVADLLGPGGDAPSWEGVGAIEAGNRALAAGLAALSSAEQEAESFLAVARDLAGISD